jgi:hypothetical protein
MVEDARETVRVRFADRLICQERTLFNANTSRQDGAIRLMDAHRERVADRWCDRECLTAQVRGHLRTRSVDTLTGDGDGRGGRGPRHLECLESVT